jgi:hypothetical protein
MDLRFWKAALTAGLASLAALLGLALMLAWVLRRQRRKRLIAHLVRLASDVVTVADSIDQDIESQVGGGNLRNLRSRSRECRERAKAFLAQRERLDWSPAIRVTRALELLHDEHRRIVDLRSEADVALAGWRQSPRMDAGRARSFGWASTGNSSRSMSSGFYTRPSTLG